MTAKLHRIHIPGVGESMVSLASGVPYAADAVAKTSQVGAYARFGNKGFVYAKAGGTLWTDRGARNSLVQKINQVAVAVEQAIGDKTVSLTIASGTAIAENELAGGEVLLGLFGTNPQPAFTRGIISNNAIATGTGGTLVLVLDSPIPIALTTSWTAECMVNPYSAVIETTDDFSMVMGMPTVPAKIGEGVWLQVSGPTWIVPQATVGAAVSTQQCVFKNDGSIEIPATLGSAQIAGTVCSTSGSGQAAPFVMLQIAH